MIHEIRHVHDAEAKRQMKATRASIADYGAGYVPGIKLHVVNVVTCKVHKVNSKVEFEFLKRFPATSDSIFFIAQYIKL